MGFPSSRLKVQHIPDCTGQYDFNLFSQAGGTDRQSCLEFSSHLTVRPSVSSCEHTRKESRVAACFFVCIPHVLTGKTSEPNTGISYLYPVISFRGISLEPHIALSLQLKKQQRGVTSESANRSVDTAEAHQS